MLLVFLCGYVCLAANSTGAKKIKGPFTCTTLASQGIQASVVIPKTIFEKMRKEISFSIGSSNSFCFVTWKPCRFEANLFQKQFYSYCGHYINPPKIADAPAFLTARFTN